jgi:hypothetical protein
VLTRWRQRGLSGDVVFGGRTLPAQLAAGVLSLELIVTAGISPSPQIGRSMCPTLTTTTSWHSPSRPSPRKAAPQQDSTNQYQFPTMPVDLTASSPSPDEIRTLITPPDRAMGSTQHPPRLRRVFGFQAADQITGHSNSREGSGFGAAIWSPLAPLAIDCR